jgi:CrcB protein
MTDTTAPVRHLPRDVRIGLVIAVGGALGALARWSIGEAWPTSAGRFPWPTFAINVTGCLAIGAFMVLADKVIRGRVYLRPFVGVGILGGFTTFSTFAVETTRLVGDEPRLALLYGVATPTLAIVAVALGAALTTGTLALKAGHPIRRQS